MEEVENFPADVDPVSARRGGGDNRRREIGSAALAQTSFALDERTADALDQLKKVYGVTSNAAVIKRALRLALIASRYADAEGDIHFAWRNGEGVVEIVVPQGF